jgi:uncharacterized RDD family membrane protein YckC
VIDSRRLPRHRTAGATTARRSRHGRGSARAAHLPGGRATTRGPGGRLAAPGPFILVELAYFTWFHATGAGQSIGNKILGIRVLDTSTGRSLPHVRAFARALMSNLSAIPLFLGFFWMLWEPRKRTWHDIVADSLVVRTTYYPPGEFGRPAGYDATS